ncbi:NADH pyrophosphatase [Desulfosarcina ovata subsp. sediminis]|uniref:NAD(+) diphosphatase n=1 Tax=Desulfosarcina ovata subsp. sediminis TaxID=885957 RepID=A0A5K7ZNW9_9BACT|nr:NAD(+) diphosphatase [Desulfosarcina ovata]BBO82097.1 NADH pyrophosphatase [Desulfosarcina ovata subsp. sediminis]
MDFVPAFSAPVGEDRPILWFIFEKNKLLIIRDNGTCAIPDAEDLAARGITPIRRIFLGFLEEKACYAAELEADATVAEPYAWMNLHALMNTIGDELFWIAGRANHLMDWDRSHRFCGRCSQPTEDKPDERAKVCPSCGLVNYPRLSPAVIVAILKDDQILLARNKRFRGPFYSVLAGFVEPGETLEQCVQREIREEVSIEVKNIRYFGSQPWPFPNSLMVGFVADYAAGEVQVDNAELMEAHWFSAHTLPKIPPRISIARQLIEWFVEKQS